MRGKIDNILLLMLVPDTLKDGQKKYFDFAAKFELNDLYHVGVDGVKVKIFSSSMDTPGRAELLGMKACQSYQGCPVCTHSWSPGPRVKCMFDGYRAFYPPGSRERLARVPYHGHVYQYRNDEERPVPTTRDDKLVFSCLRLAKERKQPIMGHKSTPLLSQWPGFSWYRFNPPDLAHGLFTYYFVCHIISYNWIQKVLIERKLQHFRSMKIFCIRYIKLSCIDLCLCADSKIFLEMLLKLMVGYVYDAGVYKSWGNKDARHRADFQKYGFHRDLWADRGKPLPWRLTREERKLLDERMRNVVWPHYVDRLAYRGHSFWTKPNRLWKIRRKIVLLYYMLPCQLRDQVPKLREAIFSFVWAMRRLEGQVHSFFMTKALGIVPGCKTVKRSQLPEIHRQLIRSLCLFEGCIPTDHLNPGMHHFCHYAEYTMTHGLLTKFWMMVFERFNKHIKGLCRNNDQPESHLSNSVRQDVSARFVSLVESELFDSSKHPCHRCFVSVRDRKTILRTKHFGDLRLMGCNVDCLSVEVFSVCHVMGIQFRSGEWGQHPRCGSVITTVVDGRSLYARVECFLKIRGDRSPGYAVVKWFSEPEYPFVIPIVVRVRDDGSVLDDKLGSIIRINDIDPSRVMIETDTSTDYHYMMRDSGYDTVLVK